jgi:hypothetical protein
MIIAPAIAAALAALGNLALTVVDVLKRSAAGDHRRLHEFPAFRWESRARLRLIRAKQ